MTIPAISQERRAEITALPRDTATHARVAAELGFLDAVNVEPPPCPVDRLPARTRIGVWNAERGGDLDGATALLAPRGYDVLLLSELDWGMARSGQHDTARELARRLGMGFAFGVEFLELGLGGAEERKRCQGLRNEIGYHGGAVLSRCPLRQPEVIRLELDGAWWDGGRGERRVGGRIALATALPLADIEVTFAAVHLDSHGSPRERAAQMEVLLSAITRRAGGGPVLIGGDLNTSSFDVPTLSQPGALREALAADPGRLRAPVPHEPLFEAARRAGYDWERCNALGEPTQRVPEPPPSARGGLKLDWILTRGLRVSRPGIVAATTADGRPLSDHELLEVEIEVAA